MPRSEARSAARRLLAAAACWGALACTASPTPVDDAPLTADTAYAQIVAASCAYYGRCVPGFAYLACQDTTANAELTAALKSGRAAFDATAARKCLDELKALACSDSLFDVQSPADCDLAFRGTVADGADCYSGGDCVPGSHCVQTACPGVCKALKKAGESCSDGTCADGVFCNGSAVCEAPRAAGGACTSDGECASNTCSGAPEGTCVAAPAKGGAGAACADGGAGCTKGLYCRTTEGGSTGTCTAQIAAGSACGADGNFATINSGCLNGLACTGAAVGASNVAGSCTAWSNLGGTCKVTPKDAFYGVSGCMLGLQCGQDGKCAKAPSSGPCANDQFAQCAGGTYCDANKTCQPDKAAGAACESSSECASGDCTGDHVCAAAKPTCHEP